MGCTKKLLGVSRNYGST